MAYSARESSLDEPLRPLLPPQPSLARSADTAALRPAAPLALAAALEADVPLAKLPPGLVEALRQIIPRRRPAKLPYIVALGLLGVVGAVAVDPSARELVAARLHVSRSQKADGAPVALAAAPPVGEPPAPPSVATTPAATAGISDVPLVLPIVIPSAPVTKSSKALHTRLRPMIASPKR